MLLCPWDFPGKNTEVGYHFPLQCIFPNQGLNPGLLHCRQSSALQVDSSPIEPPGEPQIRVVCCYMWNLPQIGWPPQRAVLLLLLLLSACSCVQLCGTPQTAAHQAPASLGFSRQEHWSGLPCPSPGDLSDPGIEPRSSALQTDFFFNINTRKHDDAI